MGFSFAYLCVLGGRGFSGFLPEPPYYRKVRKGTRRRISDWETSMLPAIMVRCGHSPLLSVVINEGNFPSSHKASVDRRKSLSTLRPEERSLFGLCDFLFWSVKSCNIVTPVSHAEMLISLLLGWMFRADLGMSRGSAHGLANHRGGSSND